MHLRNVTRYGKDVKLIYAGEFYVSQDDEIIGTLLGSCIAVCLFDNVKGIAGMNHFMLPGKVTQIDAKNIRSAKYGVTAITDLLALMESSGAERKNIRAKLFGGGEVLDFEKKTTAIAENNIRLARIMMEIEDIPILEEDTGGKFIRKVLLEVKTGKVFLKKSLKSGFTVDEMEIYSGHSEGAK